MTSGTVDMPTASAPRTLEHPHLGRRLVRRAEQAAVHAFAAARMPARRATCSRSSAGSARVVRLGHVGKRSSPGSTAPDERIAEHEVDVIANEHQVAGREACDARRPRRWRRTACARRARAARAPESRRARASCPSYMWKRPASATTSRPPSAPAISAPGVSDDCRRSGKPGTSANGIATRVVDARRRVRRGPSRG